MYLITVPCCTKKSTHISFTVNAVPYKHMLKTCRCILYFILDVEGRGVWARSVPCVSLSVFVLSRCNCWFRFAFCYRCSPSFINDGHPLYKERFLAIGLRGETFVVSSQDLLLHRFFPRFVCTFFFAVIVTPYATLVRTE
jgi:hypothetical protein